jgi:hypothetical protein
MTTLEELILGLRHFDEIVLSVGTGGNRIASVLVNYHRLWQW